jgi:5-methylcytosine-specific restriction endonuclease McrA
VKRPQISESWRKAQFAMRRNGGKPVNAETDQFPEEKPQGSHTNREWLHKFFSLGMKCYYCDEPLLLNEAEKEHKIPRCRGGSNAIRNIVPACKRCNRLKGWRTETEFLKIRTVFSKTAQANRAIDKSKPSTAPPPAHIPLEAHNDPHFHKKLRSEGESVSWAWRNPA